ncbi:hypothetical protein JDV09_24685 [Mycobacterium sp. Y57]|nr:hypothetical protein [Mycolicibacterium xanthum]MBX7435271.1 hypothetical protein [Mycolicibacterium xanthum]
MDTVRNSPPDWLRRVLLIAGAVLAAVVLTVAAVYAVTFVLLAPMMQ